MSLENKYIGELERLTKNYLKQGKGSRVKRYVNKETGAVRKVLSYRHKQVSRMKDFVLYVVRHPTLKASGGISTIGKKHVISYLDSLKLSDYEIKKRWEAIKVLYGLLGRSDEPPRPE